ncbi:MAG: NUDIX domain-containing protein [Candidatus Pacebacteria bacterium]|nr:NUDIX domain-containing protein [Candidatus Paceibacterota bacterium]
MQKGIDYVGVGVVFFCVDEKGNLIMAKRSQNTRNEHGKWDCGGGGIEIGETAEETLKREIIEEYGVKIISYEFMGFRDAFPERNGERQHWVVLDFKVLIDPMGLRIGEPDKFDDIGIFPMDKLPTPIHSQIPKALAKYKDKFF